MEADIPVAEVQPMHEPKKRAIGPVRWCKRCSRKHGGRERCMMVAREVASKGGNKATRFIHVSRLEQEESHV